MDNNKVNLEKILGCTLLIAPICSIVLLFAYLMNGREYGTLYTIWVGSTGIQESYSSFAPIYFGLMAIAGAYLIKKGKNSN